MVKVKVDNMRNQHEAQVERKNAQPSAQEKNFAIIFVVAGDGLAEIFKAQELTTSSLVGKPWTHQRKTYQSCGAS